MDVCSLAAQAVAECLGSTAPPAKPALPTLAQTVSPHIGDPRPASQPRPMASAPTPALAVPAPVPVTPATASALHPAPLQAAVPATRSPEIAPIMPELSPNHTARVLPQFAPSVPPPPSPQPPRPTLRPTTGAQLYHQRLAALRSGRQHTRIAPHSYADHWANAPGQPTHQQWQRLLAREAEVMANSQGRNRLTIMVGDSLTLWLPPDQLPRNQFWLNQSISGETTTHIRQRISYFAAARPTTIHLMAGINDLRQGATDREVVGSINSLVRQLRQQHPQAEIKVHSILPTRLASLPSDRIARINRHIAAIARQQGAIFLDLQASFSDPQGLLRRDYTTDGLHLSHRGYAQWQAAFLGYF